MIHVELRSEVMEPARFFSSLGAGAVLVVVRRSSNRGQSLGMPRNDEAAEVEAICVSGLVGVDTVRVGRVVESLDHLFELLVCSALPASV